MTSQTKFDYVTQIALQMWPCDGNLGKSSISMREVITILIL